MTRTLQVVLLVGAALAEQFKELPEPPEIRQAQTLMDRIRKDTDVPLEQKASIQREHSDLMQQFGQLRQPLQASYLELFVLNGHCNRELPRTADRAALERDCRMGADRLLQRIRVQAAKADAWVHEAAFTSFVAFLKRIAKDVRVQDSVRPDPDEVTPSSYSIRE
jgi:hypothetical protein